MLLLLDRKGLTVCVLQSVSPFVVNLYKIVTKCHLFVDIYDIHC